MKKAPYLLRAGEKIMCDDRPLEVAGVQTRHDSWVGKVATVYFTDKTRREFKAEKEIEYIPV